MQTIMFGAIAAFFVVLTLKAGADFLAHYNRYRHHIRDYPATKSMRGKVWSGTR